ncbi:discoidin domain-containing protein [Amycolatopsis sp. 195334CR]|uniref:discoidin domain-containing protein n=1 Tax=Amycolatopsis sp. 195334CR TaxID=2814588 RepID=UPI001A8E5B38|nr:discoidin domain-containing protein [Amycolatopsis sp. 195334CR]MBN6038397.1 discoidin domain-containing protein [Amycolatopsis sp. 195334CR]
MSVEPSRRTVLQAFGLALVATGLVTPAARARPGAAPGGAPDAVAAAYHSALLRHTRWAEQQFDRAAGIYPAKDFTFAVVLGNAVLLTRDGYDAAAAGVEREVLHRHTVDTIRHFARSNRVLGGTEWGKRLFFDTTFQSYFQLAGRLLWTDLDAETRANLDRIAGGQAEYTASLGTGNDPMSGDWTPRGLSGGYVGDTKLEEMGVYTQALAPGLAWAPSDARAAAWREWFGKWSRNEGGLPPADLANPRVVDGVPISANTAENLYDTFLVENHGSFGPHYQEELWRTSGRNALHFLLAGQPLPEVLTAQPNGERLWHTMLLMASDAGEPLMPMVADREHLYGRDVLPLAFRAQVLGDRYAARAEAQLAERLQPYQAFPPVDRLTKFSGEPKYEPEARAEIAISYLLHEWRANDPVRPVSQEEFNAYAVGTRDFGAGPGLLAHRTPSAWAAAVSKPGYTKFAWQPRHDDWLFGVSGSTPMLLPSTALKPVERRATAWTKVRDGFDGTAAVLKFDQGYAGFATLPSGAAVYATTGLAAGEGAVSVYNLDMPGMPGLTGSRTYRTAEGSVTVPVPPAPPAGGRTDEVSFPAVTARYVRMLGVLPDPAYGYSLWSFEVRDGAGGTDLARTGTASASSFTPGREAKYAIDGSATTRWAVSTVDRPRADSWLAVDLGSAVEFDRVKIAWEAAAGRRYRVETSPDGLSWTTAATHPLPAVSTTGGWLDVDGRAGFAVSGSPHPITVTGNQILLSDGAAAPLQVECHPDPRALPVAGARPVADVAAVRTSVLDGHLVLFNLSGSAATATVALPATEGVVPLYRGDQVTTKDGSALAVSLAAAEGRVEPAWFTVQVDGGRTGLRASVADAATLRLTAPAGDVVRCRVQPVGEPARQVAVPGGRTVTVTARTTRPYPLGDLALGATVFPAEPLPAGMSAPGAAVDDNDRTSWQPGTDGRMVVDLGAVRALGQAELTWTADAVPDMVLETSVDGRTYTAVPATPRRRRDTVPLNGSARYVAVRVRGAATAALVSFRILPGN